MTIKTIDILTGEVTLSQGAAASFAAPVTEADTLAAERATMIVSRFQAKAALLAAGLLPNAEAIVAGADAVTQLAWAEAVEFRRNSPTITALSGALGLTDTGLDDMFRAAALIEA